MQVTNKQHKNDIKKAIWAFFILSGVGIIPLLVLSINSRVPIKHLHQTNINLDIVQKPAKQPNIMVDEIVISIPNDVNKNPPKQKKKWICKSPRPLIQGSGTVKECEWK